MVSMSARPPVALAACAALTIVQVVGAKATRDTLFLTSYPASALPTVVALAAALSLASALASARWLASVGPSRAVPRLYQATAALFAIEWGVQRQWPDAAGPLLYLHLGALGPLVVSGFWSLVNERYDPHEAKSQIGALTASGTLGGLAGGVLAERVAHYGSVGAMLPVLAAVNLAASALIRSGSPPSSHAPPSTQATSLSPAALLVKQPFLRKLGLLVLLTSLTSTLLDLMVKSRADAQLDNAQLATFFSGFHALTGLAAFAVQAALSRPLLSKLGLGVSLALLPGVVLVGGALSLPALSLWRIALLRGAETVLQNSVFRSAYELLYTPIEPRQKRSAKPIIDVAIDRFGEILAAGAVALCLWGLETQAERTTLLICIVTAALALAVTLSTQQSYVAELLHSLRSGLLSKDMHIEDATTLMTLGGLTGKLDRQAVLRGIEESRSKPPWMARPGPLQSPSRPPTVATTALLQHAAQLLSSDPQVVRARLTEPQLEPELLPLVVRSLGDPSLRKAASSAIERWGPLHVGALSDHLLNADLAETSRRELAHILERLASARARDALLAGLDAENGEVRLSCARALRRLVANHTELRPEEPLVLARVSRILSTPPEPGQPPLLCVELALVLLGSLLEPQPLDLCWRAIEQQSPALRGTALEYLENVLPIEIFHALEPHLGRAESTEAGLRPREVLVEELSRSMAGSLAPTTPLPE